MSYSNRNAIKIRLLPPLALMLIASLFVFIYGTSLEEESHISEDFQRSAQAAQLNYHSALQTEVKTLSTALEFLKNDKILRQSLISGDKNQAMQHASPIFERLRSKFLITHFYLLTTERQVLLRVHEPSRHSDIIDRFTAIQAEKTGKPASGIELGTLGTFTLRVVYPLFEHDKLIGYLELGEEINHVIENVLASNNIDLSIAIKKDFLSYKNWKQGMQMLGHNGDWDRLSSFVETYSSIEKPTEAMEQILVSPFGQNGAKKYIINDKHYFSISYPLTDAGENKVGKLLIFRDMTERIKSNQQTILEISSFALLLGIAVLILFYFLAQRIERKLEEARLKLIDETHAREIMQQNHIDELEVNQTQLLKTQKQLIQAKEQAEGANIAKSQFLRSITHELRTPLNAILGFGQLLKMNTDSKSEDEQESIHHIITAGQQLLEMVDELLNFSSINTSNLEFNIRTLYVADIVSRCVDKIKATMTENSNISIENTITNTTLHVQGTEQHFQQVLINLLSNAVKYNKENGQVTVSSTIEKLGRLRIEIQDSGHGIKDEELSLLFTPFERLDQKHGAIAGLGFGLYMVKQLVEAMHGTVGVESTLEKGSTFWFELPMDRSQ